MDQLLRPAWSSCTTMWSPTARTAGGWNSRPGSPGEGRIALWTRAGRMCITSDGCPWLSIHGRKGDYLNGLWKIWNMAPGQYAGGMPVSWMEGIPWGHHGGVRPGPAVRGADVDYIYPQEENHGPSGRHSHCKGCANPDAARQFLIYGEQEIPRGFWCRI